MKAILFDLDGVITSERIYWNTAGIIIAEKKGAILPENCEELAKLAGKSLPDDEIRRFKELGINSNKDIAYCGLMAYKTGKSNSELLIGMENEGLKGLAYLKYLDKIDPGTTHLRHGEVFDDIDNTFRACYQKLSGIEKPPVSLDAIRETLEKLKSNGWKLGIVTGRNLPDSKAPLEKWGIFDYFDPCMIITDDEVEEESKKRGEHVGKPHAWPILRAIFGCETFVSDGEAIKRLKSKGDFVFVGDSVSDVLAAKAAGMPVICVNTGIASKESLIRAGADIIVKDVTFVPGALKELGF